ncbi:hypothetical protein [Algibacter sp. PT7-4]|uniref:hypothetical protein n=1 Tax=Algibacter ulvanivorans TaxID=3400999 RepID=UPI003AB06A48
MSQTQKLLNTKDVSRLFACTQRNIQRLIREGKLTPLNPHHSKGFLFDKNYIDKKLKAREELQNE